MPSTDDGLSEGEMQVFFDGTFNSYVFGFFIHGQLFWMMHFWCITYSGLTNRYLYRSLCGIHMGSRYAYSASQRVV